MKYFFKILLVLVLACITVTGMYYYTTGSKPAFLGGEKQLQLTTVSKPPVTEKYAGLTLLATLDDYTLYKSGDLVVLDYQGKRYEFSGWSGDIELQQPDLYLVNIDDDEEDELIVKAVAGYDDSSEEYIYSVYVLNKVSDEQIGFEVAALNEAGWQKLVSKYIISEIGQLKSCDKIVQLAMVANGKGAAVDYDAETGIATNAHTGYFRALQNDKGEYLKVAVWNQGKGIYSVAEDGTISVDIDVNVSYENTQELQQAGILTFDIALTSDTEYTIAAKSIRFTPNKTYKVTEPSLTKAPVWSYTELNSSNPSVSQIKWIKHDLKYDPSAITQTINAANELGDMNGVASVSLTNSAAVLRAKSGCVFSEPVAKSAQYSVVINKGTENEYDIAYTCTLSEDYTELTITFDRTYSKDEINSIEINFGTK